jgi:hypothetical protein
VVVVTFLSVPSSLSLRRLCGVGSNIDGHILACGYLADIDSGLQDSRYIPAITLYVLAFALARNAQTNDRKKI